MRVIAYARDTMHLSPDAPVGLVGLSRGSGLDVVAGSNPALQRRVTGILALALTKQEEHVKRFRRRRGSIPPGSVRRERVVIDTYEQLRHLTVPISVIQSTHDHYLNAAAARERFGPDTETRRLIAVDARNHGFGAAHDVLFDRMKASLSWIRDAGELHARSCRHQTARSAAQSRCPCGCP